MPRSLAAALPPLYSGLSAEPSASDVLLGCAALDLSALQLLGSIDGWYNILDQQQQPRGQIKVGWSVGLDVKAGLLQQLASAGPEDGMSLLCCLKA